MPMPMPMPQQERLPAASIEEVSIPSHHDTRVECVSTIGLNRDLHARLWPWERMVAKRVALNPRCHKDAIFLTWKIQAELLGICCKQPVSPIPSSASAKVSVGRRDNARSSNCAFVVEG